MAAKFVVITNINIVGGMLAHRGDRPNNYIIKLEGTVQSYLS